MTPDAAWGRNFVTAIRGRAHAGHGEAVELGKELVDWFNAVDATYRADLRELNELNFARFDAKLEQRLAELDAKWSRRWNALDAKLEQRLAELDAKWSRRWNALDAKLEQRIADLKGQVSTELRKVQADILKWMFGFWAPTAVAVVGTGLGVLSLLLRR